MRHRITIGAVAMGLALSSCGGNDEDANSTPAPRDPVDTPTDRTPPASAPGALPPEFIECMADEGFEVSSSDDIHSAPTQILQACFGALHEGGGAP